MKKIIIALLLAAFCSCFAYAQGQPATGNEWLKVDKKTRVQLVNSFMQDMKKEGVTISKGTVFYCKKLDRLYAKKPNLLTEPVWKVLKTAMIMEHDWSVQGQSPDVVAKNWLGEDLYAKWKAKKK